MITDVREAIEHLLVCEECILVDTDTIYCLVCSSSTENGIMLEEAHTSHIDVLVDGYFFGVCIDCLHKLDIEYVCGRLVATEQRVVSDYKKAIEDFKKRVQDARINS